MRLVMLATTTVLLMTALHVGGAGGSAGDSSYPAAANWNDQAGHVVSLNDWRGKTLFLALGYVRCPTVCPMIVQKLKGLDESWPKSEPKPHFILVSLDPDGDDTKERQAFLARHRLDPSRWHFLAGPTQQTEALAKALGLGFNEKTGSGHIMHATEIVRIGPDGTVKERFNGLK